MIRNFEELDNTPMLTFLLRRFTIIVVAEILPGGILR